MSLPVTEVERELLHTRRVRYEGYKRADGLWDPPYVPKVPTVVQRPVAALPGAAQVALGRTFLPANWGECIIVMARRAG